MVKRIQYLNALEIVDNYHRERDSVIIDGNKNKIKLDDFIQSIFDDKNRDSVSSRLLHSLRANDNHLPKYIDDISKYDLIRCRNLGKKSSERFFKLKKEYIN
jgi:hypothetical protein